MMYSILAMFVWTSEKPCCPSRPLDEHFNSLNVVLIRHRFVFTISPTQSQCSTVFYGVPSISRSASVNE